jgi:hypothetical protein
VFQIRRYTLNCIVKIKCMYVCMYVLDHSTSAIEKITITRTLRRLKLSKMFQTFKNVSNFQKCFKLSKMFQNFVNLSNFRKCFKISYICQTFEKVSNFRKCFKLSKMSIPSTCLTFTGVVIQASPFGKFLCAKFQPQVSQLNVGQPFVIRVTG